MVWTVVVCVEGVFLQSVFGMRIIVCFLFLSVLIVVVMCVVRGPFAKGGEETTKKNVCIPCVCVAAFDLKTFFIY